MRSLHRSARGEVSAAGGFGSYRSLWVLFGSACPGAALVVCGALVAADSFAAETEQANEPQLQEVMVTAERVKEDVQKVPVAVTVLSAETLAEQGARDFTTVLTE